MPISKPTRKTVSRSRRQAPETSSSPATHSAGDVLLNEAYAHAKAKRFAEAEPLLREWLLHFASLASGDAVLDALDKQLFVMTRLGRREEQLAFEQDHFCQYLLCDSASPCLEPLSPLVQIGARA